MYHFKNYLTTVLLSFVIIATIICGVYYYNDTPITEHQPSLSQEQNIGVTNAQPLNQAENESWTLVSGNPEELCTAPTWRGQAEIKGWYSYENIYVEGTEEWVFNVISEDQNKFPLKTVQKTMIKYGPPQTEDQLRQTTKDAPVSIVIKEVSFYCEGLGTLVELK